MLNLIVAHDRNRAIGYQGVMPWHLPEDLKHFRLMTRGHIVMMGTKTWESLPEMMRPLAGRENIVVSRNEDYAAPGARVMDMNEAMLLIATNPERQVFCIGGGQLFKAMMPYADRLVITEVDCALDQADTWFPEFEPALWDKIDGGLMRGEAPRCRLSVYTRDWRRRIRS